jgi:argininosuccinate lyase
MNSKNRLWQSSGSGLNPLVDRYTVGDDYAMDQILLVYDIEASKAHAQMLESIGILSSQELETALRGLEEIREQWERDEFSVHPSQEDGHTAIEQYLTEKYGEIGKKIHTGRSRNDQSLVMIRLYMKDRLIDTIELVKDLTEVFDQKARQVKSTPMPGYTHTQKAMPTTVTEWLQSFREAYADTESLLVGAFEFLDQNPLGSASGFGFQNFKLDREETTELLSFDRVQMNPLYCGLSRGYFENIFLQALSPTMILAGRFANDMILFSTQEFGFLSLPDSFTTGSSIMPQKRNYDLFEIMRANAKVFHSYQQQIQDIVLSLGSGYHRDLQLTKRPLIQAFGVCFDTLELLVEAVPELSVNKDRLQSAMTEDLYVTDRVYELVKQGKSFREAYNEVKKQWVDREMSD